MPISRLSPGCPCECDEGEGGNLSTVCVTIYGCCDAFIEGADVVIKTPADVEVCSGTTDASGVYCCEGVPFGLYVACITIGAYSECKNININRANEAIAFVFVAGASGVCGCDGYLIPTTLYFDDGLGVDAMTYVGVSGSDHVWQGSATRPIGPSFCGMANCLNPYATTPGGICTCSGVAVGSCAPTGTVTFNIEQRVSTLDCTPGSFSTSGLYLCTCTPLPFPGTALCPGTTSPCLPTNMLGTTVSSYSCNPTLFNYSVSGVSGAASFIYDICGDGIASVSWTVSE